MKTFFQKLILSIPLRPSVAILFCFLTGYLGMLLPSGHLEVTYTAAGKTSEILLPVHGKIYGALAIDNCLIGSTKWLIKPGWVFGYDWQYLQAILGFAYCLLYLKTYFPPTPKRLWLFALACMIFILIPIDLLIWLTPKTYCTETSAIVHSISVQWFTVVMWILNPLVGFYAVRKGEVIKVSAKLP